MPRKTWTEQEETLVQDLYPDLSKTELAGRFKRNWSAIKMKASKLKIRRNINFSSRLLRGPREYQIAVELKKLNHRGK